MWSAKKCSDNNASTPSAEEEIKVVLVGDTQCGKTSLVQRFVSDTFIEVLLTKIYPVTSSARSQAVTKESTQNTSWKLKCNLHP
ncbi:unnamed protein product [Spodoptera exigua]|nr:unnamed protein product [Spodoptera exigua]